MNEALEAWDDSEPDTPKGWIEGGIGLPKGATSMDEEAKREIRERILETVKRDYPDLTPEATLFRVDSYTQVVVEELNGFLLEKGGFNGEGPWVFMGEMDLPRHPNEPEL